MPTRSRCSPTRSARGCSRRSGWMARRPRPRWRPRSGRTPVRRATTCASSPRSGSWRRPAKAAGENAGGGRPPRCTAGPSATWRLTRPGGPRATGFAANTCAAFIDRYEAWLDAHADWPLEWQDAAGASDYAVHVSPARLAAFNDEFSALVERYRRSAGRPRRGDGRGPPPRLPAAGRPRDDRPRRPLGAPPLPRAGRPALAADRPADPGHRPAGAVARPVADRDRARSSASRAWSCWRSSCRPAGSPTRSAAGRS